MASLRDGFTNVLFNIKLLSISLITLLLFIIITAPFLLYYICHQFVTVDRQINDENEDTLLLVPLARLRDTFVGLLKKL